MELLVNAPEVFAIDVGVNLCGGNIDVTEHLLDGAEIGATLE